MLAENISGIAGSEKMNKTKVSCGNLLTCAVAREKVMTFLKFCIRDESSLNNRFVVPEHVSAFVDWDFAVTQHGTWVSNLFSTETSSNEFETARGCFGSVLFLDEPFDRCLVEVTKNVKHEPFCEDVMHEVGINT